jgi:hypothetical protein
MNIYIITLIFSFGMENLSWKLFTNYPFTEKNCLPIPHLLIRCGKGGLWKQKCLWFLSGTLWHCSCSQGVQKEEEVWWWDKDESNEFGPVFEILVKIFSKKLTVWVWTSGEKLGLDVLSLE